MYRHTQRSPLAFLLLVVAGVQIGTSVTLWEIPLVAIALLLAGLLIVVIAASFGWLTVSDGGDHLNVRFGPLPLFGTRIPYADITAVEPGRSSFIDGWGIHYIPWRGWTYNLWGFSCVKLTLVGNKVIRVGSNDAPALADFLRTQVVAPAPSEPAA